MTTYERYCMARDSKGLKDANIASGTNIGKSTFSDWKSGRSVPKSDKLHKIAEFLDISFEWLSTGEEKEDSSGYYLNDETAEIAQNIFENKELRLLYDAARDAQPEDIQTAYDMLLALKRKERGNID